MPLQAVESKKLPEETLRAQGVSKVYRQKKGGDLLAVNRADLVLRSGECLGVVGESGCGKSTLARMLMGMEKPSEGIVSFEGRKIADLLRENRLAFRRNCQIVFQNPFEVFDPLYTVGQSLVSVLKIHRIGQNRKEREQICIQTLEQMGVRPAADLMRRRPNQLSGGQLQRIAITRSMLLSPKCLAADEAVSMLDVSVRAEIVHLLIGLMEKQRASLLFISHDIAITRYISHRILVMYQGEFVESAPAEQLAAQPIHPYTQALIAGCRFAESGGRSEAESRALAKRCAFAPRCPEAMEQCWNEKPPLRANGAERTLRCWRR